MFYDFFCSDPKPDPDPENLTRSGQKVRNRLDPQHLGGQLLIKGEKPLYLPRKSTTGTHTLPFTIFDLVHMQVILSDLLYRWTAVYPNSFYLVRVPVTALPIKRTNSLLPRTWLPFHTFFLHVHHAFYYYSPITTWLARNVSSLQLSTHQEFQGHSVWILWGSSLCFQLNFFSCSKWIQCWAGGAWK